MAALLNWVSHAALALALMALVALPLHLAGTANAPWIGAAFGIAFYYGREKRDHENRIGGTPLETWRKGWWPGEWTRDGIMDLLWPLVACIGAALAVTALA